MSFGNITILVLFTSLAIIAAAATILLNESAGLEEGSADETWWMLLTVFINAIAVAILTQFFAEIVKWIVTRENHSEDADFENSMIVKSFTMSSFISFGGLMMLAYW